MDYNFPTLTKLPHDLVQDSMGDWYDQHGNRYIDGFTDVGAAPIPVAMLEGWVADGIEAGVALRKPHIFKDKLRDEEYPLFIGSRLGLGDDVRLFYSNSGSEAVEVAIKLARKATGRTHIISFEGDFHGRTYAALSSSAALGPEYHRAGFGPLVPDMHQLKLDAIPGVGNGYEEIAAVLLSPINGNNTLEDWPDSVWELCELVQARGGLIIFDEVQTGFGRSGGLSIVNTPLAPKVTPDIWCFGKAAGAGWPFSLTVSRADLVDHTMTAGTQFNTMAGAPMGCYLSMRMVECLENGLQDAMIAHATRITQYFQNAIRRGYMMALEVPNPYQFVERALDNGVILMTARPNKPIRLSPLFTIDDDQVDALMAGLQAAGLPYWS